MERYLIQYNFYNWGTDDAVDAHFWVDLKNGKLDKESVSRVIRTAHGNEFEHLNVIIEKGVLEDDDEWYEYTSESFSLDLHIVCGEKDIMLCSD